MHAATRPTSSGIGWCRRSSAPTKKKTRVQAGAVDADKQRFQSCSGIPPCPTVQYRRTVTGKRVARLKLPRDALRARSIRCSAPRGTASGWPCALLQPCCLWLFTGYVGAAASRIARVYAAAGYRRRVDFQVSDPGRRRQAESEARRTRWRLRSTTPSRWNSAAASLTSKLADSRRSPNRSTR